MKPNNIYKSSGMIKNDIHNPQKTAVISKYYQILLSTLFETQIWFYLMSKLEEIG